MGYARYIGRIGALAVALGIGAGLAATPWVASAKPSDSGSSNSSSNSSSSSSSSPGNSPPHSAADLGAIDRMCEVRLAHSWHNGGSPMNSEWVAVCR